MGFSEISLSSHMNDNYSQYGNICLNTENLPGIAPDCPPEFFLEKSEGLKVKNLTSEVHSGLLSKINCAFWVGLGIWSTYNIIDTGLANLLALETLTHGTGPLGYIGISMNGADPNYGGGSTGSSEGIGVGFSIRTSQNFFHVFKDSEQIDFSETALSIILPRMHAVFSGIATLKNSELNLDDISKTNLGTVAGIITPTLKFRFTPEEILNCVDNCRFENDPYYGGSAYRTSQPISSGYLGITGSLSQGVNFGMLDRMTANPAKVMLGVILLGIGAYVAKKTYQYAKSSFGKQVRANNEPENTIVAAKPLDSSRVAYIKDGAKALAVSTGWATLALTTIFLNTL